MLGGEHLRSNRLINYTLKTIQYYTCYIFAWKKHIIVHYNMKIKATVDSIILSKLICQIYYKIYLVNSFKEKSAFNY